MIQSQAFSSHRISSFTWSSEREIFEAVGLLFLSEILAEHRIERIDETSDVRARDKANRLKILFYYLKYTEDTFRDTKEDLCDQKQARDVRRIGEKRRTIGEEVG